MLKKLFMMLRLLIIRKKMIGIGYLFGICQGISFQIMQEIKRKKYKGKSILF